MQLSDVRRLTPTAQEYAYLQSSGYAARILGEGSAEQRDHYIRMPVFRLRAAPAL